MKINDILKQFFKGVAGILSVIFGIVGMPLSFLFDRKFDPSGVGRILIMNFEVAKMGDAILSGCVIGSVRKAFPKAHIAFLANDNSKELYAANPNLDETVISKYYWFKKYLAFYLVPRLRKMRFDLVINLSFTPTSNAMAFLTGARYRVGLDHRGTGFLLTTKVPYMPQASRGMSKHEVEYYLDIVRSIGIKADSSPEIFATEQQKKFAEDYYKNLGIGRSDLVIGFHPGGYDKGSLKYWNKEGFAAVAEQLAKKHSAKIVIRCSGSEKKLGEEISALMKSKPVLLSEGYSFGQMAAIFKRFDLFICNDSGPMHMAAAVGVPIIALFGPTNPNRWGPYTEKARVLTKDLRCRPCFTTGEFRCINKEFKKCLQDIKPQEVMEAAEAQLKKYKNSAY